MTSYRVQIAPAAQRQVDRLRGTDRIAVRGIITALGDDPRPRGAAKLRGARDLWRVRARIDRQAWRIVYQLRADDRIVVVAKVVRRDESTYRKL